MNANPMFARDLMTSEVVSVPPNLPVTSLARLIAARGVSSVPVMDSQGRLLGIVTEADLLRRLAGAEDVPVSWLRRLFRNADRQAAEYARTHGFEAQDVMTRDMVSVGPDATAEHCAHLMEERSIKRLPVVQDGRIVGIVSRADLLRAVLEPPARIGTPAQALDVRIRAALRAEMLEQPWARSLYNSADVQDGVVTLYGYVSSDVMRSGLRTIAASIEGVTRVEDRMEQGPLLLWGELV